MDIITLRKIKNAYTKQYKDRFLIVDLDTYDQPVVVITHGDGKSWAYAAVDKRAVHGGCYPIPSYDSDHTYICLGRSNAPANDMLIDTSAFVVTRYTGLIPIIECKNPDVKKAIQMIVNRALTTHYCGAARIRILISILISTNALTLSKFIDFLHKDIVEMSPNDRSRDYVTLLSDFCHILQECGVKNFLKPIQLKKTLGASMKYLRLFVLSDSRSYSSMNWTDYIKLIPYYSYKDMAKYTEIILKNICDVKYIKNIDNLKFIAKLYKNYKKVAGMIGGYKHKDALRYNKYRDYLRMRNDLPSKYTKSFPVIPKNVRQINKLHDNMIKVFNNYQLLKEEEKLKCMNDEYHKNHYKEAQAFEYENDKYIIKACENIIDLVKEGQELHHCVGSYTRSVSQGFEYILFLRKKKEIDTPFFTIDVTPEKRVRQIHGLCNCCVTPDIKPFVDEWIEKFKLDGKNYSGCLYHL